MGRFDYLATLSPSTVGAYRSHYKRFFNVIYPEEPLFAKKGSVPNEVFEKYASKYFSERRKRVKSYEADLDKLFVAIKDRPALSVREVLCAVKAWLEENEVELPHRFWKRLARRTRGSRALTRDRPPSKSEFKAILAHLDSKGRALFLLLASSGMRIGEALQLQMDDIDLDLDPPKINILGAYTKTGNSRITFCSNEAKEAIQEWLKYREKYLATAAGRAWKYGKNTTDEKRVFPFESATALEVWTNAAAKAGIAVKDNGTGRLILHPHTLRKFFRTELGKVIPTDVVETLMGHEGYLTDSYRRLSDEDLEKSYLDGEPAITIFTTGVGELTKMREEFKTRDEHLLQENQNLKDEISRLSTEFSTLKQSWAKRKNFEQKWMGLDYDKLQEIVSEILAKKHSEILKELRQAESRTTVEDMREAEEQKKLPGYAQTDVLAKPANNV
jgi:integrase